MAHKPPGSAPPIREVTDDEIRRHLPLVRYTLGRMQRKAQLAPDVEFEDLVAVGNWGVWEALRRWEPAKGKQSTYLSSYIWGYVMHYQRTVTRANGWHREHGRIATVVSFEHPVGDEGELTIGDTLRAPDDTEDAAYWSGMVSTLERATETMAPAPASVVRALLDDRPVSHVAPEFGISRQRVAQVKDATVAALRPLLGLNP